MAYCLQNPQEETDTEFCGPRSFAEQDGALRLPRSLAMQEEREKKQDTVKHGKPLSHSGRQLSKKKYVYWILSVHIRSTVSVLCQVMLSSVFKIVCRDLPPGLGPEERLTGGLGDCFCDLR